ncbi:GPI inositol-deacylase isoform X2 [Anastrepha obliqua]|uniref:GPI inositol-deacylase isoform X2 n=1 Tax=Anastrepha obliqua TaxID=95512 RepID=UPI002409BE50|nr:GPI inositol-deacylase isoform X2 [Anastrepha obliqua]
MLKNFFVIVIILSAVSFFYGVYNINVEVEQNACQMTYMFEKPQFSRVYFSDNEYFPHYGLYYYNEGRIPKDVETIHLNGAPVIFVPGNGGSYKQVRSLASVALRKRRGNAADVHLDYFTIDFKEELSALYGNYLERQTIYLKACIKAVLKMYANNKIAEREVVIIGHSMGAVVAYAVLRDVEISKYINTIISLSAPIKKPLIIVDKKIDEFYKNITDYMSNARSSFKPNENTNFCSTTSSRNLLNHHFDYTDSILKNVLLISIGGGNRDLLVQPGLTISTFSDLHSMTMSIPKVWISCDHLSAVWCLQLMLVINRYMFDISTRDAYNYVYFIKDRILREQVAVNHFVKPNILLPKEINIEQKAKNKTIWSEDSRRSFSKGFREGPRSNFIQLIPLWKHKHYHLYVNVLHLDHGDFLFGCSVKSTRNENMFCKDGISLSHHFQTLPSPKNQLRSVAILDINNLRNTYANWSHIGLFVHATRAPTFYSIDIHNPKERQIYLKVPRWSTLQKTSLVNESVQGTLYFKIFIQGLEETYPTIELRVEPLTCMGDLKPIIIKMCIPWAPGFTKYQTLLDPSADFFYVNVPVSSPIGYNSSRNPISLEIFLDSSCRYHISYKFSVAGTMSKVVQQFYQWIPSHLTAVMLIILKNQIWHFGCESHESRGFQPFYGFFQYSSLYIITGCRILGKLLTRNESIDTVRGLSFYLVIIIHSTAIVSSILAVSLIWILTIVNANGLSRMFNWCLLRLEPTANNLPVLFGTFIISLAIKTCGGLALVVTCILYFCLISNAYRDHTENWILKTAISLHKKARCVNGNRGCTSLSCERQNHTNLIRCEGMNNFSFHLTLFILLCIMTALNFMSLVAWMKDKSIERYGDDSSLIPSLIVISSLIVLWLLKAPRKISSFGICYKAVSILLYVSASSCIIYCQEALYQLNFIIVIVFVLLGAQELLGQGWEYFVLNTRKNK